VTGRARICLEGIVAISLHEIFGVGDVGVVAHAAIDLDATQPQMLGSEIIVVSVVAVETGLWHLVGQEARELALVRQVTSQAITLFRGRMCEALLHSRLELDVTAEADPGGRVGEQHLALSAVGKMAGRAFATFEGGMARTDGCRVHVEILMTAAAQIGLPSDQKRPMIGGMRLMADIAIAVLER
jgi:hypothetical protein